MKVEDMDPRKIKPGDRFREEYGDLSELKESIIDKGLIQPLVVNQKMFLMAGGRRLAACLELYKEGKLKVVPVVVRQSSGELDLREIELIENALRKDLEWPERARLEKRIFELKKAQDPEWSQNKQAAYLDQSKGATQRRLALADWLDVMPELEDFPTEDMAHKAFKKIEEGLVVRTLTEQAGSRFKEASKWAESHYKIGDAIEGLRKVNSTVVGFAEVDPPFGVDLGKRKSRNKGQNMLAYNEIDASEYGGFVSEVAAEVYRILQDNAFCVWWFGMTWYDTVLASLRDAGFHVNDIPAIWVKGISGQTASPDTMLGSGYEAFFIARKGLPKLRHPGRSNVFEFKPVAPQKKIHPTEKPIELLLDIIDTMVWPGSIICCPFLGSGVTLRAAYQREMTGFGWDLDEMNRSRFLQQVSKDSGILEERE